MVKKQKSYSKSKNVKKIPKKFSFKIHKGAGILKKRRYCVKSQDFKVFLNFKQLLKQLTFLNFSQPIIKVLHRLLETYQKYFDRLFLDTIKVKV